MILASTFTPSSFCNACFCFSLMNTYTHTQRGREGGREGMEGEGERWREVRREGRERGGRRGGQCFNFNTNNYVNQLYYSDL